MNTTTPINTRVVKPKDAPQYQMLVGGRVVETFDTKKGLQKAIRNTPKSTWREV